jgi:hypothetical protein
MWHNSFPYPVQMLIGGDMLGVQLDHEAGESLGKGGCEFYEGVIEDVGV